MIERALFSVTELRGYCWPSELVREEGRREIEVTVGAVLSTRDIEAISAVTPDIESYGARKRVKTFQIFSFDIVMGCIAGISLLVGGIGIMNIMLASILERTREIGVRRAVGARRRDIWKQFLVEALALSLLGGVAGIIFGFGASRIVALYAEWSTVVTGASVALIRRIGCGRFDLRELPSGPGVGPGSGRGAAL